MSHEAPIRTKCWIKFLHLNDFEEARSRGSHHEFTCPGKRTIPVWANKKEIPFFHIRHDLHSMGIDVHAFKNWKSEHC